MWRRGGGRGGFQAGIPSPSPGLRTRLPEEMSPPALRYAALLSPTRLRPSWISPVLQQRGSGGWVGERRGKPPSLPDAFFGYYAATLYAFFSLHPAPSFLPFFSFLFWRGGGGGADQWLLLSPSRSFPGMRDGGVRGGGGWVGFHAHGKAHPQSTPARRSSFASPLRGARGWTPQRAPGRARKAPFFARGDGWLGGEVVEGKDRPSGKRKEEKNPCSEPPFCIRCLFSAARNAAEFLAAQSKKGQRRARWTAGGVPSKEL